MICPSCDTPNRDDAKFCKKCGHSFRTEAAKAPEVAQVSSNATSTSTPENDAEDISLAPTQIISPQQMMAFHATRWQQDVSSGQPDTPTPQASEVQQAAHDASGMSAANSASSPAQQEQAQEL